MPSRKNSLVVSYGKHGITVRFQRKPSKRNRFIGDALRGKQFNGKKAVQDAFAKAVSEYAKDGQEA